MKYKLLALDMDGTLLNDNKEITEKTQQALIDAQKAGVKVVIASGRMPLALTKYAEQLKFKDFDCYCICFNGGLVLDGKGEVIHKTYLDKKYLKVACDMVKDTDITVVVHRNDGLFGNLNTNEFTNNTYKTSGNILHQVEDLYSYTTWDIHKLLFVGELEKLKIIQRKLIKEYGNELEVVFSCSFFLEVMPKGVDKSKAIDVICRKHNIKQEEVVACGDNFNDESMINYAGVGVVMFNGKNEMKKIANYITKNDNNDNGIEEVVKKFFFS